MAIESYPNRIAYILYTNCATCDIFETRDDASSYSDASAHDGTPTPYLKMHPAMPSPYYGTMLTKNGVRRLEITKNDQPAHDETGQGVFKITFNPLTVTRVKDHDCNASRPLAGEQLLRKYEATIAAGQHYRFRSTQEQFDLMDAMQERLRAKEQQAKIDHDAALVAAAAAPSVPTVLAPPVVQQQAPSFPPPRPPAIPAAPVVAAPANSEVPSANNQTVYIQASCFSTPDFIFPSRSPAVPVPPLAVVAPVASSNAEVQMVDVGTYSSIGNNSFSPAANQNYNLHKVCYFDETGKQLGDIHTYTVRVPFLELPVAVIVHPKDGISVGGSPFDKREGIFFVKILSNETFQLFEQVD